MAACLLYGLRYGLYRVGLIARPTDVHRPKPIALPILRGIPKVKLLLASNLRLHMQYWRIGPCVTILKALVIV